jgi:hypothetical protein
MHSLSLSEPTAALALMAVSIACTSLLLVIARPVPPLELPSLALPEAAVTAQLREDADQARNAPDTPRARELEALLWKQGAAERHGLEYEDSYRNRRRALELGYRAFVSEVGEERALRLRSKAVAKLEDALELRLKDEQAQAVIGVFATVLAREGLSRDGYLVAPEFVVRTLYKARWNILHGLAPDYALEPIEKRAFYGWKALHAEHLPLASRIEALHAYGSAGGVDLEEALGVLLFRMGDYKQSLAALRVAYQKHPNLRLRNYLLSARIASGSRD